LNIEYHISYKSKFAAINWPFTTIMDHSLSLEDVFGIIRDYERKFKCYFRVPLAMAGLGKLVSQLTYCSYFNESLGISLSRKSVQSQYLEMKSVKYLDNVDFEPSVPNSSDSVDLIHQ